MSQVLGTFAPEERKFHKSESSKELNVLSVDFSLPGTKVHLEQQKGLDSLETPQRLPRPKLSKHFKNVLYIYIGCKQEIMYKAQLTGISNRVGASMISAISI